MTIVKWCLGIRIAGELCEIKDRHFVLIIFLIYMTRLGKLLSIWCWSLSHLVAFYVFTSRHLRKRRKSHWNNQWAINITHDSIVIDSHPIWNSALWCCRKVQKKSNVSLIGHYSVVSFCAASREYGLRRRAFLGADRWRFKMRNMLQCPRGSAGYLVWPRVLRAVSCTVDRREWILSLNMWTTCYWWPQEYITINNSDRQVQHTMREFSARMPDHFKSRKYSFSSS